MDVVSSNQQKCNSYQVHFLLINLFTLIDLQFINLIIFTALVIYRLPAPDAALAEAAGDRTGDLVWASAERLALRRRSASQ